MFWFLKKGDNKSEETISPKMNGEIKEKKNRKYFKKSKRKFFNEYRRYIKKSIY